MAAQGSVRISYIHVRGPLERYIIPASAVGFFGAFLRGSLTAITISGNYQEAIDILAQIENNIPQNRYTEFLSAKAQVSFALLIFFVMYIG